MAKKNIYIGADHGGFSLKEGLKKYLMKKKCQVKDLGCFSDDSVDYPDVAKAVCHKVQKDKKGVGILMCGTGIGMMMTANKMKGIRATVATQEIMARLARKHNNANVLCLGGRTTGPKLAKDLVDVFLKTEFEGEERHKRRLLKMEECC